MKKKISLALAGVMALSTLPMSVFAASTTNVNVPAIVNANSSRNNTLFVNNTTSAALSIADTTYGSVEAANDAGYDVVNGAVITVNGFETTGKSSFEVVLTNGTSTPNWANKLSVASEVQEFVQANSTIPSGATVTVAEDKIYDNRLVVTIDGATDGDATVKIPVVGTISDNDSAVEASIRPLDNNSDVSSATVTVATSSTTVGDGSTTTTIPGKIKGESDLKFDLLTAENTAGAFGNEVEEVTYTLSSDFEIESIGGVELTSSYKTIPVVTNYDLAPAVSAKKISDRKFVVKYDFSDCDSTTIASSIKIKDIEVSTDADFGTEAFISVSPDSDSNFSKQSGLSIGTYADYSFGSALVGEEVPTLPSGELAFDAYDSTSVSSSAAIDEDEDIFDAEAIVLNDDLFTDYHATAPLKFSEKIAGSFVDGRSLTFTLPEDVEVVGIKVSNVNKFTGISNGKDFYATADNETEVDNQVTFDDNEVTIKNITNTTSDAGDFTITFYVASEADFTGDVTVEVSGSAIAGEVLEPVTVATMAPAFAIDTKVTTVKPGVQSTSTADIVVSELNAGQFVDGEKVTVSLDAESAAIVTNALNIVDADVEVTSGDLEIKNVKVSKGAVSFEIVGESTEPSEVTISNVKVSTSSVLPETNEDPFNVVLETSETYDYGDLTADYIGISSTGAGAASGATVQVQPGNTTYLVDGVEKTMDVAPFIDASTSSLMVPVRFIADGVGITEEDGNLIWSAHNKTVIIRNGSDQLEFPVGANFYRLNGVEITNENNAVTQIVDGRTFVPFRTVGQALDIPVSWDEENRVASYN